MGLYRDYLEEMFRDTEARIELLTNELATLPDGRLFHTVRDKKPYFFRVNDGDNTHIRKSINKKPELIRQLARKVYLQKELALLDSNWKVLRDANAKYVEPIVENVLAQLSPHDRKLADELFLKVAPKESHLLSPARFEELQRWAAEPYYKSSRPFKRENISSRGLILRSRAELLIAEKLYEYELPFRYEQMVPVGGNRSLAPDFSFLDYLNEPFYWEYCGMMDDPDYEQRHIIRMHDYERVGIVPWRNLICTYDGGYHIDIREVVRIIENEILPRMCPPAN